MKLRILQIAPKNVNPRVTLQVDGRLIFNVRATEILKLADAKSLILYVDDDSKGKDIYLEISSQPPQKLTYRLREGKTADKSKPFFYAMTTKFFKEYGLPFDTHKIKFKLEPHRFRLEGGKMIPDKHGQTLLVRLVEQERLERGPKQKRNRKGYTKGETLRPLHTISLAEAPWLDDPNVAVAQVQDAVATNQGTPSNSKITIEHDESHLEA